jgi:hypothetical protein
MTQSIVAAPAAEPNVTPMIDVLLVVQRVASVAHLAQRDLAASTASGSAVGTRAVASRDVITGCTSKSTRSVHAAIH